MRHCVIEKPQVEFHSQDTPHCFVDPRLRHGAFLNQRDQQIGKAVIVADHAHIDPGHHGQTCRIFFVDGNSPILHQSFDIGPVRNDKAFETKFIAQNVAHYVMIRVNWNAIDVAGVDHHRARSRLHARSKCRQEVFAQIIFRNPRRGSISAIKGKTVPKVMLQRDGNVIR